METLKIKVQIREIQNIRTIEKMKETKTWFSEINNTDRPLATLIRKQRRHKSPIQRQVASLQTLQALKGNKKILSTLCQLIWQLR